MRPTISIAVINAAELIENRNPERYFKPLNSYHTCAHKKKKKKKKKTTFDYQISDDLLDFPRLAFCGVHVEIAKNNLTIISDLLDFLVHNILVRELKRI